MRLRWRQRARAPLRWRIMRGQALASHRPQLPLPCSLLSVSLQATSCAAFSTIATCSRCPPLLPRTFLLASDAWKGAPSVSWPTSQRYASASKRGRLGEWKPLTAFSTLLLPYCPTLIVSLDARPGLSCCPAVYATPIPLLSAKVARCSAHICLCDLLVALLGGILQEHSDLLYRLHGVLSGAASLLSICYTKCRACVHPLVRSSNLSWLASQELAGCLDIDASVKAA
eukprot:1354426-Pleurochrysis_carterae.AAC.1